MIKLVLKQKKKINIAALFAVLISVFSCSPEEVLTPAEQSLIDEEIIQEYLKSNKLVLGAESSNKINWTIEPAVEGETTLMDIADKDTSVFGGGVEYYFYYIEVEKGVGVEPVNDEIVVLDFNEFLLDNTLLSGTAESSDALELELSSRITGLQKGISNFLPGKLSDTALNYREDTEGPGKGILILPSGLAYKSGTNSPASDKVLRLDMVFYTMKDN